jgi:hypothetical protein
VMPMVVVGWTMIFDLLSVHSGRFFYLHVAMHIHSYSQCYIILCAVIECHQTKALKFLL